MALTRECISNELHLIQDMQYNYERQDKEIYIWTHYYMPL